MKGLRRLLVACMALACASPPDSGADTAASEYASDAIKAGAALNLKPPAGREVRVFFIGNSLTFYNDMPKIVERLAWADGVNLHAEQYAPGGVTLRQHTQAPEVSRQLAAGKWDFVVLQEQSQLPAFDDEQVRNEMFPPAEQLTRMARAASPGVQIVLYSTPAHKDGNPGLEQNIPGIGTYEGMQRRSIRAYEELAPILNAVIAPVGRVWMQTRAADGSASYYRDDRHPNLEGSYLIACVFYSTLTGRTPVGNRYFAGLDSATGQWLQQMAVR